MTWVVGAPIPFGYSVGLADIRVTFRDGSERDCIQKIYQVGPVVCAAFAGSVRIGFAMLSRISHLLKVDDSATAWDLDEVSRWWPQHAREVWNRMPDCERALQSEFMLFGAHPDQGYPWAKPYVYSFRSPRFDPAPSVEPLTVCSLGKGASIRTYCQPLQGLRSDEALMKLETGRAGGIARGIMNLVTESLLALPIRGISPHLHVLTAFRDRVEGSKNDRQYFRYSKDDASMDLQPVLVMPEVATSYAGFQAAYGGAAAVEGATA